MGPSAPRKDECMVLMKSSIRRGAQGRLSGCFGNTIGAVEQLLAGPYEELDEAYARITNMRAAPWR